MAIEKNNLTIALNMLNGRLYFSVKKLCGGIKSKHGEDFFII